MFSIVKFFGGFAFWKGEILGKLIYFVIVSGLVCGAFYVLFIRPTHKTTQNAAQIITNVTDEAAFDLQLIPPKIKIGGFRLKLLK